MNVKHHIGDDLIHAYAAGEVDEAVGLLVATHLALCPACREILAVAEAIGGGLIEAEPAEALPDDAFAALMARVETLPDEAPAPRAAPGRAPVFPKPLRDYAGGDADAVRWRGLGGGVRHLPIATGASRSKARLLYIPAGEKVPDHGHRGMELTLVLSGAFYDGGAWFRRGDVEEADATIEHQPVAGPEEDCICLAVTDAPLRFKSLLPRLVQPFLGI